MDTSSLRALSRSGLPDVAVAASGGAAAKMLKTAIAAIDMVILEIG
jgi:hypothetical protein